MAEAFYNRLTGTTDATSAGVDLQNSTKGDDPSVPELVIEAMGELGYDIKENRRKTLTKEMVDDVDQVIAMITDFPLPDYLLSSSKLAQWNDIPDAVRTPLEFHRVVRDLVLEHVTKLVTKT